MSASAGPAREEGSVSQTEGILPRNGRSILLALGLAEAGLLTAFGWLDNVSFPLPRLLWPLGAVLCYFVAGHYAGRNKDSDQRQVLGAIWSVGILMRVALLPLAPELSDDVYRYLWDGHVQRAGINPYLYAPSHEAVEGLRTTWHGLINNPDVPTIYPPLTQLVFLAVSFVGGSIMSAKVVWILFDLAAAFLLGRAATRSGRSAGAVLVWYLWCPLLVVESAWSAHFDPVGLFWIAALLLASVTGGGAARVGTFLAAATLTKLAPAAALPAAVRRYGWKSAIVFGGLCLAFYAPYARIGIGPLTEGLKTYSEHWTANEGAFWIIHRLVPDRVIARALAASVVLGVVGYVTWKRFAIEEALLWILAAGLLMSPTVHPWYALWILPMAALRSNVPLLLLCGLVFLGYWGLATYQATGIWPQPGWARAAMWIPVWGMLIVAVLRRRLGEPLNGQDRYGARAQA